MTLRSRTQKHTARCKCKNPPANSAWYNRLTYLISYRKFPGWVKLILIRKVEDIAAIGIEGKNEPQRFEAAFKDVPRDAWHVFTSPTECDELIQSVVAKYP